MWHPWETIASSPSSRMVCCSFVMEENHCWVAVERAATVGCWSAGASKASISVSLNGGAIAGTPVRIKRAEVVEVVIVVPEWFVESTVTRTWLRWSPLAVAACSMGWLLPAFVRSRLYFGSPPPSPSIHQSMSECVPVV